MKILQVTAPREFVIREVPVPQPGAGEVLLRIQAVTTCPQWDLHLRHNEPMFVGHQFTYPYMVGQPGHEATGVIEQVGEGVTGLQAGDRVSAWRDAGHDVPGCYAQFVVHKADNVIRVPEGLPHSALASLELAMCIATVFRQLVKMDVIRGRVFGVSGLGPAGLIAIQMAKAEGAATVFGVDPLASRRERALHLGAEGCFSPGDMQIPQAGLETSVDCVGSNASVAALMDNTSDILALFGVQREDYIYQPRHKRLTILGYKGHLRESAEYAIDFMRQGKLNLGALVSHQMPLEQYSAGIDLLETQQAIKVLFLPWE